MHKPSPPLVAPSGPNQEEQSTARSQVTSAPHPTHCWEGSWQTSGWTPGSARVSLLHREAKLARLGAGMESLGTDTSLGATLVLKHGEGQAWPPLPHWQLLGAAPGVLPLISVARRALQRGNKEQKVTSPIWPPNWPSEPPCCRDWAPCWGGSLCL